MGSSKTEEFTTRDNRLAQYAKALAHPARIAILRILMSRSSCVCGELVDELPLSQSTISQHLKELKEAGLIKGEIEGVKTCYCIDAEGWKEAHQHLKIFFETFKPGKHCC